MPYSHVNSKGVPLEELLDAMFDKKEGGYYIELGANDGLTQSNTAFFEFTRKWRGILVEPSPDAYRACVRDRPNSICVNAACVSNIYSSDVIHGDFDGGLMSSIGGSRCGSSLHVEVAARTLESILDVYGAPLEPDLLSVDAEGYELEILRGLNLRKYRPLCVLVEVYNKDYDTIMRFMSENGYILHSNLTGYNPQDNPGWDGTHNDYLFVRG